MRTIALLVALIATGTAQAAMLCARPRPDGTFSATVKIREACKPNEVELGIITSDPLRLSGPPTTSTSVTSTSTTSSSVTTLPPCTGEEVGGFCWYAASSGTQNCNQVCAGVGRSYNEATRTFAGSDGTLTNCRDVAVAFGNGNPPEDANCSTGSGCSIVLLDPDYFFIPLRCVTPATTADAVSNEGVEHYRLCACS